MAHRFQAYEEVRQSTLASKMNAQKAKKDFME